MTLVRNTFVGWKNSFLMEKLYSILWFTLGMFVAWAILMFPRLRRSKPKGEANHTEADEFSEPLIKAENVLIKRRKILPMPSS